MGELRWLWLLLIAVALASGGILFWQWFVVYWIEPHPGQVSDRDKSSDLSGDLRRMWETQNLGGTPDPTQGPNPRCSTDRAINAASRAFNTVELIGKTRQEVVTLLGDPKSCNDSIYNFPFWPAARDRWCTGSKAGAYGWQFNVVPGADGRIQAVERHWIH